MIEIKRISAKETFPIRSEILRKNIPLPFEFSGDWMKTHFIWELLKMAKMAKSKKDNDDIFKNLEGFCQMGARASSPGNIPTGHFQLDFIIQYGQDPTKVDLNTIEDYDPRTSIGIPLGKLVEIFGEEGGGKSSLGYRICGYAQKLGYKTGGDRG